MLRHTVAEERIVNRKPKPITEPGVQMRAGWIIFATREIRMGLHTGDFALSRYTFSRPTDSYHAGY